jgi:hypothetical protein
MNTLQTLAETTLAHFGLHEAKYRFHEGILSGFVR